MKCIPSLLLLLLLLLLLVLLLLVLLLLLLCVVACSRTNELVFVFCFVTPSPSLIRSLFFFLSFFLSSFLSFFPSFLLSFFLSLGMVLNPYKIMEFEDQMYLELFLLKLQHYLEKLLRSNRIYLPGDGRQVN